jgi:hypothetical protein
VIDLLLLRRGEDDEDAAEGLVMDGGEEGALTLSESSRVQWPHFYDSPRLKLYRLAGAVSFISLAGTTINLMGSSSGGVLGFGALVLFTAASVPLSL